MRVCFFHKDCFDGLAAAMAFALCMDPHAKFIPADYSDPIDEILGKLQGFSEVYILDFSFSTEDLKTLLEDHRVVSLTMIDHHPRTKDIVAEIEDWIKTRAAVLDKTVTLRYSPEESGALMTWRYMIENVKVMAGTKPPAFFQYISDWDTHKLQLPFTEDIIKALGTYPIVLEVWLELYRKHGDRGLVMHLLERSEVANAAHTTAVDWTIRNTLRYVPLNQFLFGVDEETYIPLINCAHGLATDALKQLCEQRHPGVAISYYDRKDGRKFSVRCREGDIARRIARANGGDGHERAAGFVLPFHNPLTQI